ncbi:Aspartic peptidase [Parasponia andersonii]|uniref:Aspartic proteinase Asp1 n=1 Tax=Parasponia andersonii TaxID=3476 RepID=A0A2P5CLB3_PARAD|nr:Aspartic peptidase [Parasponia andersonii]
MNLVKLGLWLWVLVLVMGWSIPSSSAAFFESQHKRKFMRPVPSASRPPLELNRRGSSVVFPIHGNVYPLGYYNVTLNIGQPPKPYFLDPDTGSDLTWLQCDAPCVHCTEAPHPLYRPSNDLVACRDLLCLSLHAPGTPRCENPSQCDYEVEYADGGSSLGVLVNDSFALNFTDGVQLKPRIALGLVNFGPWFLYLHARYLSSDSVVLRCGYDQIPGSSHHPIDGVLGLGRGKTSIVSQLNNQGLVRNVVGHCLSGRGGGFLFFGDDLYDSSRLAWAPMLRGNSKHYSPGYAELKFDGKSTGLKNLLTIFDSGSSYTYLNSQAYHALTVLVKRELSGRVFKEEPEDQTLLLCWKGKRPFKSIREVRKYFKTIALEFTSGEQTQTYELPPEAYLIISSRGNVCLGILNGTEVGLQNNIIGDISMQDKMVIYDNEKQVIGWVTANCDKLPKTSAVSI